MKKTYTHIVLLIDRSGSMQGIKKDMEGGLKEYLAELKKVDGKCTITAAEFDDKYDIIHSLKDLNEIDEIQINPRGFTALIDSMVKLIDDAGKELAALPEAERPDQVLFVTITDGGENGSREYTSKILAERIKHQEDNYKWVFSYLGANQDAFGTASQTLGMRSAGTTSMNYTATTDGISAMFSTLSSATATYMMTGSYSLQSGISSAGPGIATTLASQPSVQTADVII